MDRRSKLGRWAALGLTAATTLAGCSSDGATAASACGNAGNLDKTATISVQDGSAGTPAKSLYEWDISTLSSGSSKQLTLAIRNNAPAVSARPLAVKSVTVSETTGTGGEVSTPNFACSGPGDKPCDSANWPQVVPAGYDAACKPAGAAESVQFTIKYTRTGALSLRRYKVAIVFDGDVQQGSKPYVIEVATRLGTPSISCSPNPADFGKIGLAEAASTTVVCINQGKADLQMSDIKLLGSLPVTIGMAGLTLDAATPLPASATVTIAADDSLTITGTIAKLTSEQKMAAILRFATNDPSKPQIDLTWQANASGPCVSLSKTSFDFGLSQVGVSQVQELQIKSCGADDLVITGAEITQGAEQGFAVGFATSCFSGQAPTAAAPVSVPQGLTCSLQVIYTAPQLGAISAGKLTVHTSAGERTVLLSGKGESQVSCPKACMTLKNLADSSPVIGQAVIPQTKLVLDASCSTPGSSGQAITKYKWSLTQPPDSYAVLTPSDAVKIPQIQPNSAGAYTISLDVIDAADVHACAPAVYKLNVTPDDKLHIELTWDTPGDPDKTDVGIDAKGKKADGTYAGTDLDLHLASALAEDQAGQKDYDKNGVPDPWFAVCYDCSVFNGYPDWDEFGNYLDNPKLDRDDKDGWGPEIIYVKEPPAGEVYTIGVLYNAAHAFGKSIPTVRVFLDGQLQATVNKVGPEMVEGDLWCAGQVSWQPNNFKPCKGADAQGNLLTHKYPVIIQGSLLCP